MGRQKNVWIGAEEGQVIDSSLKVKPKRSDFCCLDKGKSLKFFVQQNILIRSVSEEDSLSSQLVRRKTRKDKEWPSQQVSQVKLAKQAKRKRSQVLEEDIKGV